MKKYFQFFSLIFLLLFISSCMGGGGLGFDSNGFSGNSAQSTNTDDSDSDDSSVKGGMPANGFSQSEPFDIPVTIAKLDKSLLRIEEVSTIFSAIVDVDSDTVIDEEETEADEDSAEMLLLEKLSQVALHKSEGMKINEPSKLGRVKISGFLKAVENAPAVYVASPSRNTFKVIPANDDGSFGPDSILAHLNQPIYIAPFNPEERSVGEFSQLKFATEEKVNWASMAGDELMNVARVQTPDGPSEIMRVVDPRILSRVNSDPEVASSSTFLRRSDGIRVPIEMFNLTMYDASVIHAGQRFYFLTQRQSTLTELLLVADEEQIEGWDVLENGDYLSKSQNLIEMDYSQFFSKRYIKSDEENLNKQAFVYLIVKTNEKIIIISIYPSYGYFELMLDELPQDMLRKSRVPLEEWINTILTTEKYFERFKYMMENQDVFVPSDAELRGENFIQYMKRFKAAQQKDLEPTITRSVEPSSAPTAPTPLPRSTR